MITKCNKCDEILSGEEQIKIFEVSELGSMKIKESYHTYCYGRTTNQLIDKIIKVTAEINKKGDFIWGHDTNLGTVDEIRNKIRRIVEQKVNKK